LYCHNNDHPNHMTVSLSSTSSHVMISSSVSIKSLYKMSKSYLKGFVHILCNIFFKAIFFNIMLKLLTKCCEQYQWYSIGLGKIQAMEFLIVAFLYDIIHNLMWSPITYQQSKSKNQFQLLFVTFPTIKKYNG
jgi:hypothetical protein